MVINNIELVIMLRGFIMEPIVELKDIVKEFPGVRANDHINLTLCPGETHALVGENGAGKSTLMKILYGQFPPDSGQIIINGNATRYDIHGARELGIGMVYQNFMQIPEMSILENIMLGTAEAKGIHINYKSAAKKVRTYLDRFAMKASPRAAIKTLSVGERQKIEIIKALYFDAKILILDEPTAVLTPQESQELFSIIHSLKKEGRAIVFISHKLREVIEVGDRITVMRRGKVVEADWKRGDVGEVEIARAMVGKKDVQLIQNERTGEIKDKVLEVKNVWYFDEHGIPKIRDLSFDVREGEILGVGGVEGNGQTELIQLLIGLMQPSHGNIIMCGAELTDKNVAEFREAGMGFISDDRMTTGLLLEGTAEDNIIAGREYSDRFSRKGLLKKKEISSYTEDLIERFTVKGVTKGKAVRSLSGGNIQKIILAREISSGPKVLIAAQPTRGLDIGAVNFVRKQLLDQKAAGKSIVLISADLEELMSLSDRLIVLYEGSISGEITDVANATEEKIGLLMGGISES